MKTQERGRGDVRSIASDFDKEATLNWGSKPQSWKQAVLSSRPKSSSSKELQLIQIAILGLQKIQKW